MHTHTPDINARVISRTQMSLSNFSWNWKCFAVARWFCYILLAWAAVIVATAAIVVVVAVAAVDVVVVQANKTNRCKYLCNGIRMAHCCFCYYAFTGLFVCNLASKCTASKCWHTRFVALCVFFFSFSSSSCSCLSISVPHAIHPVRKYIWKYIRRDTIHTQYIFYP